MSCGCPCFIVQGERCERWQMRDERDEWVNPESHGEYLWLLYCDFDEAHYKKRGGGWVGKGLSALCHFLERHTCLLWAFVYDWCSDDYQACHNYLDICTWCIIRLLSSCEPIVKELIVVFHCLFVLPEDMAWGWKAPSSGSNSTPHFSGVTLTWCHRNMVHPVIISDSNTAVNPNRVQCCRGFQI